MPDYAERKPRGRIGGVKPRATRTRVTITIPTATLEVAVARVEAGQSTSLSAYLSEALAEKVAQDVEHDGFLAYLRTLDAELGPPSAEDYAWARQALGL